MFSTYSSPILLALLKIWVKKRLRTLKDLDKSALTLAEVCALILDEETGDSQLRDAIFALIPKPQLAESIATVHQIARPSDDKFHDEMVEQYGRVRREWHCLKPPLPLGEGWGEGMVLENDSICSFAAPHPNLLPEGEGTKKCQIRLKAVPFGLDGFYHNY